MTHKRIAIVAKMHGGKTSLAERLMGFGYQRVALADQVKQDLADALNLLLDGYEIERAPITVEEINANKETFRVALQWLGTDFFRKYLNRPTHWIDVFEAKVEDLDAEELAEWGTDALVVCDDVRFPNEAEALRAMGFVVVKVVRDEEQRLASIRRKIAFDLSNELGYRYEDVSPIGTDHPEVEARLQNILSHDSETKVDEIEADLTVANTRLADLDRAAAALATGIDATPLEAPPPLGSTETAAQALERIYLQCRDGFVGESLTYQMHMLEAALRDAVALHAA